MNPILKAREYGQSIWLDYIRRDLLESGELGGLILAGEVCGVTSNPSIFEQAISGSELYHGLLRPLAQAGWSHEKIFDTLAIDDIREATDLFLPLYEATNGAEGFVSIEVDPQLADDTEGTLAEARRLWSAVNRPNVMIKIPATQAGLPAIERATQEGLNINVTLIFSLERHTEVMEAYLRGLEARAQKGESLNHVNSVASFFVSRVDTKVDDMLEALVREEGPEADRAAALRGKIAIANAKLAYAQFRATFGGTRFGALRTQGALPQRPLWASTSTKNPSYPDTYYVDNLIGANTVNTIPPHTLAAFRDHGAAELTLEETLSAARGQLGALEDLGLSMQSITDALEREGVEKFAQSYKSVLGTVRKRAAELSKEIKPLLDELQQTLAHLDRERFGARLWQGDPTLWGGLSPAEETQTTRGAWMTLSQDMQPQLAELHAFAEESRGRGLKHIVFIALGSVALTLRALSAVQEADQEGENHFLDAPDPVAIRRVMRRAPIGETLYVVVDQPGFEVETQALLAHFWERAHKRLGEEAGKHFIAIAGTESWLAGLAKANGFGACYRAPSELRGGYRALSLCGLLPAVLMGVDVQGLLQGAARMARRCGPSAEAARNPGLFLGTELGTACRKGRRHLTIVADGGLQPLADWVGQLVVEFAGDEAGGVLPIVGEPPGSAKVYGDDRMMLYLRNQGRFDRRARGWVRNGLPVAILDVGPGAVGLGAEFFRWQMATAALSYLFGLEPPDQPEIGRGKDPVADHMKTALERAALPELPILWQQKGITIWGQERHGRHRPKTMRQAFEGMFGRLHTGDRLAFMLHMPRKASLARDLAKLRKSLRDRMGVAVSVLGGWQQLGLAGQAPKRGVGRTVVVSITAKPSSDLASPSSELTIGAIAQARAMAVVKVLQQYKQPAYGVSMDSPAELAKVMKALLRASERKA